MAEDASSSCRVPIVRKDGNSSLLDHCVSSSDLLYSVTSGCLEVRKLEVVGVALHVR